MSAINLSAPTREDGVIVQGHYVMVKKLGGEHIRSMKINPKQQILIEKLKLNSSGLIGQPFGLFEVTAGQPNPICARKMLEEEGAVEMNVPIENSSTEVPTVAPSGDQLLVAGLNEAQARQRYSEQEIDDLKKSGTCTTSQLVAKLVEGSATFQNRTEYAKSKYIRKKAKKHSDRVLVLRPSIRLLCESYYRKDPERVGNMRGLLLAATVPRGLKFLHEFLAEILYLGWEYDQLGLLLQMAGIHSGKKVVLFEQSLGLVTSAIIERLGGRGQVVHLHRGPQPQGIPCVHSMNYSDEFLSTFYPLKISCVLNGGVEEQQTAVVGESVEKMETADTTSTESADSEEMEEQRTVAVSEAPQATTRNHDPDGVGAARRAERIARELTAYSTVEGGFDALVIATRTVDPVSVLELLYDKLRPCGTITIYGPVLQPMVEAHSWLRNKGAVNVQMFEQMFRVHQVLPNRTHPLMSQMVVGGVLVSAIKVIVPSGGLP